jgi:hypothetical protein
LADGQVPTQRDLLIVDHHIPPLFMHPDYHVVPVECLYVAIEVRARLDTTSLHETWRKQH